MLMIMMMMIMTILVWTCDFVLPGFLPQFISIFPSTFWLFSSTRLMQIVWLSETRMFQDLDVPRPGCHETWMSETRMSETRMSRDPDVRDPDVPRPGCPETRMSKTRMSETPRCVNQMVLEIGQHLPPNMVYNAQLWCSTSGKNGGENILLETLLQNAWAAERRWWQKVRKKFKNLIV